MATDIQGNRADFDRVVALFEREVREPEGAALVFTGDLIHGPEIPERIWPEYLGNYYRADSPAVLRGARRLAEQYPGRVTFLLGNHEHAHVGGPVVGKFFPDEAQRLEALLGPSRSRSFRRWLTTWPLVAVARQARLLMLHAAPNAVIDSPEELDRVALDSNPAGDDEGYVDELLAQILWARTASTRRARAFLTAIDPQLRVAVYGHDVVRRGWAIDREPLLCISTSFGCFDGDKLYLQWDLSEPAPSASELAQRGLRPLYPEAKPVYREPYDALEAEPPPSPQSDAPRP